MHGARERAAADLDDEPVEAARRRGSWAHLLAERLAALDREPVDVALAGERQRAGGERGAEARATRGVACAPGRARADRDARAELLADAPSRPGRRRRGTKTCSVRPAGRGDDRGRERGVAAARDREVAAGAPESARPRRSATSSWSSDAEQVARLVRARDVPGLVLHPDAASAAKPSSSAQLVAARERRDAKAVPVDGRDARRRAARTSAQNSASPRPPARGDVVGVEQPRGSGRTDSARRRPRGSAARPGRARAGGRGRRRRRGPRSGSGTGRRLGPATARRRSRRRRGGWRRASQRSSTPVRALNSSISSSQAGDRARAGRVQKAGSRRASKSSSGHALLLDPGEVAEVEDPLRAPRASARAGCRSRRRAGARRRPPPRRPRRSRRGSTCASASSRSLSYIAAPSVATVTTTSSRPEPSASRS